MLNMKLIQPSVLTLPLSQGDYTLDTDSCKDQNGCVLPQNRPTGTNRPIGYWSWSLNSVGKAYDMTHRECLAIVLALLLLWSYLNECVFTVRTDNDVLNWILSLAAPISKLTRWRLRLSNF